MNHKDQDQFLKNINEMIMALAAILPAIQTNVPDIIMTIKEVAEYMNVSQQTVHNWFNDGRLPKRYVGSSEGTKPYVLHSDLINAMKVSSIPTHFEQTFVNIKKPIKKRGRPKKVK